MRSVLPPLRLGDDMYKQREVRGEEQREVVASRVTKVEVVGNTARSFPVTHRVVVVRSFLDDDRWYSLDCGVTPSLLVTIPPSIPWVEVFGVMNAETDIEEEHVQITATAIVKVAKATYLV